MSNIIKRTTKNAMKEFQEYQGEIAEMGNKSIK